MLCYIGFVPETSIHFIKKKVENENILQRVIEVIVKWNGLKMRSTLKIYENSIKLAKSVAFH